MSIKVYEYQKCSTCVKAIKFLDAKKVKYTKIAIAETPPTQTELKQMLKYLKDKGGSLKNLFNTSGILYRENKISEKLNAGMTEAAAIKLLSENGKLVKRPFLLTETDGCVGFKEDQWKAILKK